MRLLLDTHVWLWMQATPERFSPAVRDLIADAERELWLSAASSWEIAIKHALGRLELPEPPTIYVGSRLAQGGIRGLAIEHRHALRIADLPQIHRDPFDRILVAQALCEEMTLVSADPTLRRYEVPTLDPRAETIPSGLS